jgi:hypothetical protein
MTEKVLAYTTNQLFEAEMIKKYLFDHQIPAFILNKMDSAYLFGDIEILVYRDDLIRAKKLIGDFHKHE